MERRQNACIKLIVCPINAGMNIGKFAAALGVDTMTFYAWIGGLLTPDQAMLEKIGEVSGIPWELIQIRDPEFISMVEKGGEGMKKFKEFCSERQIKQKDIAELLNISIQSASRKINGKESFTLNQVKTICLHYGISADKYFV